MSLNKMKEYSYGALLVSAGVLMASMLPDFAYRFRFRMIDFITSEMSNEEKIYHEGEDVTGNYVWPADIDRNNHVNNARYLRELNFKRRRLFFRLGIWPILQKSGRNLLVVTQTIRYRQEMKLMQYFRVRCRILAYSDKDQAFYIESRFESKSGFVMCIHIVKYKMTKAKNPTTVTLHWMDRVSTFVRNTISRVNGHNTIMKSGKDVELASEILEAVGMSNIACADIKGKCPFIDSWEEANFISSKELNPERYANATKTSQSGEK